MAAWEFWSLAIMAALLVGASKGGLPVVSMLAVPLMSLTMSPVMAAGLLLPIYVVSDLFGLWAYRHDFDRRVLAILAPSAAVGVGLGWATAQVVPEDAVTGLVGMIGLVFALNILLRQALRITPAPARSARVLPGAFWGVITGFTSFVSHAGGPPFQVYVLPLRLSKTAFAGTSTILFAFINAVKLPPYWALGQITVENLRVSAVLALPAALAVFGGVWLVRLLPERVFFQVVTWALLVLSLKLLWGVVPG